MIAWTGPRADLFQDPAAAQARLTERAREWAARPRLRAFVCGGQRGVDHWAAQAGLQRSIPVWLVLPAPAEVFACEWPAADQAALFDLCRRADRVEVVGERPSGLSFDRRNERLVALADQVIAVWTGVRRGGTFYTLCAARERGLNVEEVRLEGRAGASLAGRGV